MIPIFSLRMSVVVGVVAAVTTPLAEAFQNGRPNIIIVMTDDQGYPDMSCHGHPLVDTPNMDELSAQSVRFTGFHVDPFCSPTRAALMTGRMSGRTGVTATFGPRNFLRRDEVLLKPYLDKKCHRIQAAYYASITRADWNLGRLMEFLEEEALAENTILVFLTDNGTVIPLRKPGSTVEVVSGMRGMKGDRYEGGHRVPCFMRGPEGLVGQPRDIDALTSHIDLLPTFIDLCGLQEPDRPLKPLDGRSFRPLLEGKHEWADRLLVLHHQNGPAKPRKHVRGVVLASEWRLIMEEPGKYELYKIREDRSQSHDVAAQHPEIVRKLLADYDVYWESLDVDRPLGRPVLSRESTLRLGDAWQRKIREAAPARGFWLLETREAGRYRFEVRRWPREADAAMRAGLPPARDPDVEYVGGNSIDVPGVAMDIEALELKLSGHETMTKEVPEDAQGVMFDVELAEGPVDLEAKYIMGDGKRTGAYYVYAWKL